MSLTAQTHGRIESLIVSDRVVLFMKGTRDMPQCGFSATTIGILDNLVPTYTTFNVLEDPEVREGIKSFSEWPTIPQLFVEGEFVGGCDIVKQLFNTGALHETLGVEPPDCTPPELAVSEPAAALIREAVEANPGTAVHLQIDSRWQHNFNLGPVEGHEVRAEVAGIPVYMDVATAQKARGLKVEVEETLQGRGFVIENPNAPPPVNQLEPTALKAKFDAGEPVYLFDVRPEAERARASIAGARPLDERVQAEIMDLPKDACIVFQCHVGQRSQAAAEHFRLQGFTNVHNLAGGIEAWSSQVDPSVPRY